MQGAMQGLLHMVNACTEKNRTVKRLFSMSVHLYQGIENIQERKLGKIFLYANNGKNFEKLFTSTLNGIAVSVWCVFSTLILHAGLSN